MGLTPPPDGRVVVIRGARVIDGVGDTARTDLDVIVTGELISAIEPADPARPIPPDATVIDGSGATLLPGLIDCHAHYTIDPTVEDGFVLYDFESVEKLVLRAAGMARRALEGGVTTARSAGSPANLDVVLSAAIDAGQVAGPRMLAAGPALTITGGHGYQFGREADGPLEFVKAVRANVRDGAEVIKIVSSEAAMLTSRVAGVEEVSLEELEAVVAEARRLQRRVLSHAQNSEAVRRSATGRRGERRACVPRRRRGARDAPRDGHDPGPDADRDRCLEGSPRSDRCPARAPARDRAAPSTIVRIGDPSRDRRRHRNRHRRARGDARDGLARDLPAQ